MTERRRPWFLAESPDVLEILQTQARVTIVGMEALRDWAAGDIHAADRVRDAEHRADEQKRALWIAVREALSTPLDPEDLFAMSSLLDEVMNRAKDVVREAELLDLAAADAGTQEMADQAAAGLRHLATAFAALRNDPNAATAAADAAVKCERSVERAYRKAVPELLASVELRVLLGRLEQYRRLLAIGDGIIAVAERVWYAVVKES
jgi:uncharacterized protein